MPQKPVRPDIQTRRQLFDFFQTQMQSADMRLHDARRSDSENSRIKTYVVEADVPPSVQGKFHDREAWLDFLRRTFAPYTGSLAVLEKEEDGFFEIRRAFRNQETIVYADVITNPRFWNVFSLGRSDVLDRWLESVVKTRRELDFVWFWPDFLERIQKRGAPRGFGLDYDYRWFEDRDSEETTYLKMQLWGGNSTQQFYESLKKNDSFNRSVVLSKVRFHQTNGSSGHYALQEVRYTGKFTTRGTDLGIHLSTLSSIRKEYAEKIRFIEEECALEWTEESGRLNLNGGAIYFIPQDGVEIPVELFCQKALAGSEPFRLLGFAEVRRNCAVVEVVDLHTSSEMSLEVYPDMLTLYLPKGACGNTVARIYANLQHTFSAKFTVEADHGKRIF